MSKPTKHRPWLTATLLVLALFGLLWRIGTLRFENSDDALILKAFMGFEGGVPASFSLYVHTLLAWALHGLARLWPGVAWLSLFQLGVLGLSAAVLCKSLMQLAGKGCPARMAGVAAALLSLLLLAALAMCRINYTTTAALAGAAAVAQCLAVPPGAAAHGRLRAYGLAALLLGLACLLRMQSAWPAAAFAGLALLWQAGEAQRTLRPSHTAQAGKRGEPCQRKGRRMQPLCAAQPAEPALPADPARGATALHPAARSALLALAGMLAMVVVLLAVRQGEIALRGLQGDAIWHAARTALLDYTPFEGEPAPALGTGLLPATLIALLRQWYFLDGRITTEVMRAMAGSYPAAPLQTALAQLGGLFADFPRYQWLTAALLALYGLCLLPGRKAPPFLRAAATLAVLGAAALFGLLAAQGRLPPRAADAVLLPAGALLLGLALLAWRLAPATDAAARATALDTAAAGNAGNTAAPAALQAPPPAAAVGSPAEQAGAPVPDAPTPAPAKAAACANDPATLPLAARTHLSGSLSAARTTPLQRGTALALLAALLLACGMHARLTLYTITRRPDAQSQQRQADLERYALANPQTLILRSPNLLRDTRLFPDVRDGIPGNTAIWGDWSCRTPGWYAQLAAFGLDGHALDARAWLDAPLQLAVAAAQQTADLQAYLTDAIGQPVLPVLAGQEGTLRFYRFETLPAAE